MHSHCNSPPLPPAPQKKKLTTRHKKAPFPIIKVYSPLCVSIATAALSTILGISPCKDEWSPGRIYPMLLKRHHPSG